MPAAKHSTLSSATTIALVACALVGGCVTHRHEARPVEAVLEVRVNGQWVTVKRERYLYEKPMDDPYANMPTVELEALERQAVADGDWPKVSAIRILLEQRKLGIVPKEE